MKAKEYFRIYIEENQDKSDVWRLVKILEDLFIEIQTMAESRKVKFDDRIIPIIKEQEMKSFAIIKLINQYSLIENNPTFTKNALRYFIKHRNVKFYELIKDKMGW